MSCPLVVDTYDLEGLKSMTSLSSWRSEQLIVAAQSNPGSFGNSFAQAAAKGQMPLAPLSGNDAPTHMQLLFCPPLRPCADTSSRY